MSVKYWRITGYKGKNDYDGLQDNNVDITVAFDSRFKKEDVEDIMFFYWSKKYRSVALKAELVEPAIPEFTRKEIHSYQIIKGEDIVN